MREILLSNGLVTLVDDEDYEYLNQFFWCFKGYAVACSLPRDESGKRPTGLMHREIMKPPKGFVVDHIDGNVLNNTRANLRVCTQRQNMQNIVHLSKTSRYPGVSLERKTGKWGAYISVNGKTKRIGAFVREIDAFHAYEKNVISLGQRVLCNLVEV